MTKEEALEYYQKKFPDDTPLREISNKIEKLTVDGVDLIKAHFCMREQLLHNTMCKVSCNPSQRLKIMNTGRRGNLPAEVYISDDEWFE